MKLSIVTTLYRSSNHIIEFYQRASIAAKALVGDDYEVILVNDGSPDDSLEVALKLLATDVHITIVDLSRNFGHHKAMMSGLSYARGERIFLIDCDLEEDPEWLLSFDQEYRAEKCDVVFGRQGYRKGGVFERFSGHLFWKIFNIITSLNLAQNVVTARLMSRRYVNALLLHEEREIFMAGLWHITGFKQIALVVQKKSIGTSTYTLRRKIALLVNSITAFSNAPLIAIFYLGGIIFLAALIYISYLLFNWWFIAKPLSGWTSAMASIWLLGGLTISAIGIVGIYLSKIFSETKQRPYVIVREVFGR